MKLLAQLILIVGIIVLLGPMFVIGIIIVWILIAMAGWDKEQ